MYLHVGGETLISSDEVIAILDGQAGRMTMETRRAIKDGHSGGSLRDVSNGTIDSYIVTSSGVYACSVSANTLKKRIETGHKRGSFV